MGNPHQEVATILERLSQTEGVDGVELIRRDGQCLLEHFRPELDILTYSRLSAELAAASERVLPELRATGDAQLVTNAGDGKVIVVRADDNLLLAALTRTDQTTDGILEAMREAAPGLARLLPPR